MNQQQRAGKHPSFSRDRKPPGLTRETFLKDLYPRKEDWTNNRILKADAYSFNERDSSRNTRPVNRDQSTNSLSSLIQAHEEKKRNDQSSELLGALKALELLGIDNVTSETVDACCTVCHNLPWAKLFLSGQFQKAKEFLLHVAVEETMKSKQFNVMQQLVPQIQDKKLVMCMLNAAVKVLGKEHFQRFMRTVYMSGDHSFERCLKESLCHKQWEVVHKVIKECNLPEKVVTTVLEAAIHNEKWDLVRTCIEKHPDKRLLHQAISKATECRNWQTVKVCLRQELDLGLVNHVLVEALKFREWDTVQACMKEGVDIATACTETRFDLNTRSGDQNRTVLEDAIGQCNTELAEMLLKAGADPDTADRDGETALHKAVFIPNWRLLALLLEHSRTAGEIVSRRMQEGDTLLHIVCEEGQVDILQILLLKGADPLVTDATGITLLMAAMEASQGRENLIRVLIQSGVATHKNVVCKPRDVFTRGSLPLSMSQAIKDGQLRIALMLYASGACSRKEIHDLATSESIREKLETSKRRDILSFLSDISSQPRSLQDCCILKISHLIGCGSQRDVRAASLGLPQKLRGLVLQDHVVNPDFLKNCLFKPDKTQFDIYSTWLLIPRRRRRITHSYRHFYDYYCGVPNFFNTPFMSFPRIVLRRQTIHNCSCLDETLE
ncbi:putative ankyrin repeat protein RBE_0220 [Littorina saxatilis]|uniref:putative ankyrin repeat protein RBE_0220 n=1 Tax=Littorina saxatilis TaxID=31220 RepID=UPI0038B48782